MGDIKSTPTTVDHLAVLIWSIFRASLPDESGHHLGAVCTTPLASLAQVGGMSYDVALVRRITTHAAQLVGYKDWEKLFHDTEDDSWASEALLVCRQAGEQMQNARVRQLLFDSILARLANLEAPFGKKQHLLLSAVKYFASEHFTTWEWSYDALLDALKIFLHQNRQFSSQSSWGAMLSPICFVLARINAHQQHCKREASRDLMSRIVSLILILGNQLSSCECDVIYDKPSGSALAGRTSLLHRPAAGADAPVEPNMESTSAEPAASSFLPSIWSSACAILSVDHDKLLAQVATNISADLCSDNMFENSPSGAAPELLQELLSSERMMKLILHPDGQTIAANAAKLSSDAWRQIAGKLRAMERVDQQVVEDLVTTAAVQRSSKPGVVAEILSRMRSRPAKRATVSDPESAALEEASNS